MKKYIALFIMLAAGYIFYLNFPVSHGPGVTASEQPAINTLSWPEPITYRGASLKPVKKISGEVRVIKRKKYYFDDLAKYSPIDVLVGWKELSDERNLDYLYFTLNNRTHELNYTKPPVELSTVTAQTDLWHLIPSSSKVEDELNNIRNGNIIYIKGLLVNISNDTNFEFVSATDLQQSTTKGSFNIWVEELHIR